MARRFRMPTVWESLLMIALSVFILVSMLANPAKEPKKDPVQKPTYKYSAYLVKLDDNGQNGQKIGCGDSVIEVSETRAQEEFGPKAGLELLFSYRKDKPLPDGLYNSLRDSYLEYHGAQIVDGTWKIYLLGQLKLIGTCEDARMEAQLNHTVAKNLPPNTKFAVFIEGQFLHDIISTK